MVRVVRGLSATLSHTFYVDGVATNPSPDVATVTITRDDGTVIVTNAPTTEAGAGVVTYTLTPAVTALLDTLTVTWTATIGGQSQGFVDTVEVAGGVLFTIAQARAISALATKPIAEIVEARTLAETAIEDVCGVAFVPRYKRVTVSGSGSTTIMLPPRTTAIRSVNLAGTALSAGEIADIQALPTGEVYNPGLWTSGYWNYELAIEHGWPSPPPRITKAALLLAKSDLVSGPIDDRALTYSTEDASYTMAVPGMRGSDFGIPYVDAAVTAYSLNVAVG